MTRSIKLVLSASILSLALFSGPSAAIKTSGGQNPLAFNRNTFVRQSPVEQFNFYGFTVTNPTNCAWDVDDNANADGIGYLAAGMSASYSYCRVEDALVPGSTMNTWIACVFACVNPDSLAVTAPSPNLTVMFCMTPGRCWTPPAVFIRSAHRYEYAVCAGAFYVPDDPAVQTIPDSGGGFGVVTGETFSVTNATARTIKDIYAQASQSGWAQGSYACSQQTTYNNNVYPLQWTVWPNG